MTNDANFRVLLGSTERRGIWTVPSHIDARVTLGNLELDLRQADLGPDTTIEADVTLGNLEILVPEDVAVEVDVDSFAGTIADRQREPVFGLPPARVVRVVGRVRFGNCEVTPLGRWDA